MEQRLNHQIDMNFQEHKTTHGRIVVERDHIFGELNCEVDRREGIQNRLEISAKTGRLLKSELQISENLVNQHKAQVIRLKQEVAKLKSRAADMERLEKDQKQRA